MRSDALTCDGCYQHKQPKHAEQRGEDGLEFLLEKKRGTREERGQYRRDRDQSGVGSKGSPGKEEEAPLEH